jgi:hypothetical protein
MGCGHPISHEEICAHGVNKSKGSTQNKKTNYAHI